MSLTKAVAHFFNADVRQRGLQYFRDQHVFIKEGSAARVFSYVAGSDDYEVEVTRDAARLNASCTCPYVDDRGEPCKHIWATLLAADEANHLLATATHKRLDFRLTDTHREDWEPAPEADDRWETPLPPVGHSARGVLPQLMAKLGLFQPPTPLREPSRPRAQPPAWQDVLNTVRQLQGRDESAGRSLRQNKPGQQIWIIDGPATKAGRGLTLESAVRQRKQNGEWSKPMSRGLALDRLVDLAPEDQRIIAFLLGANGSTSPSYYQRYYSPATASRWVLSQSTGLIVLPEVCRTGRAYLRIEEGELVPLSWDDGPAYEFELALRPGGKPKQYQLVGMLRRGDDDLLSGPHDAYMIMKGGVIFVGGRVVRFHDQGVSAWLLQFKEGRLPSVNEEHAGRFLSELFKLPFLPKLELPEKLRFQEVSPPLKPHLKICKPKSDHGRGILLADLSFDYDGVLVDADQNSAGVYEHEKHRLVRRDFIAEGNARAQLAQLGLRPAYYASVPGQLELKAKALPKVVKSLTAAQWHVEADGKLYRQSGAISLEVTSGIDWFELHGDVSFGDQRASLPALLAALQRGENSVQLDDGTFGMLPQDWLKKYGVLAGLGKAEKDHLRFQATQLGVLDVLLAAQPEASCDGVFTKARDRLRRFEGVKAGEPPSTFQGQLRPYQADGLGWLHFLRDFSFGGCLADDMGLGKTVQVLALLDTRRRLRESERNGSRPAPSLVVVPRSLVFNWMAEAQRFTPKLRMLDHTGIERIKGSEHFDDYDVILTTYGTLRRDARMFKDVTFDYCILDEAQAIKNASTESAKAARLLKAQHRLAMSGTPVENHLGELWSLFEFLNPGMLGAASVFQLTGAGSKQADPEMRDLLARALRPFILRRTKEQVAKDLPHKTEQTLYCELEPAQRKQYDELKEHYRRALLGRIDAVGLAKSKIMVLEALLRLRQAACHLGLLDKNLVGESSAKLDALLEQLKEVCAEGHKALVFSQFTSFLAILKDRLKKEGLHFEYLDGKTRDRQERVERFQNDPDCPLFLISLKAGGLGLNLTAAEYVFLLDPWWNPAVEAQAIDRTHRIGQVKPVFAYRLIAKDTVEEKVLELQKTKRDLADAIINADNSLIRSLDRQDLELLLS